MPRATKEQSEATAAAVRAAARRLYAERDHRDVPLEEVARRAGVTRGAVYHHYGSRDGLFVAVHEDVQASVAAAVLAATAGLADPRDQLEAGCLAFLRASASDDARRIMLVDGPAVLGWERWRDVDAAHSARLLQEVLTELATAGRLRATSVPAATALLSGAMNEAAVWVAGADDPGRAVQEASEALSSLLEGIVGPACAVRTAGPWPRRAPLDRHR